MRLGIMIAAATLACATPLAAQEEEQVETSETSKSNPFEDEEFMELFTALFPTDDTPIEPDQLALGEQVAGAILPEGSYRRVMSETFSTVLQPLAEQLDYLDEARIAIFAGVDPDALDLDTDTKTQITELADPNFKQRNSAILGSMFELIADVAEEIEPDIRVGLARGYAKRFTAAELEDIIAFMKTPSGQKFGVETFPIMSGKEVVAASVKAAPKFIEKFANFEDIIGAATGELPPERTLEDLDGDEREKLASLLGVQQSALGTYEADEDDSYFDDEGEDEGVEDAAEDA